MPFPLDRGVRMVALRELRAPAEARLTAACGATACGAESFSESLVLDAGSMGSSLAYNPYFLMFGPASQADKQVSEKGQVKGDQAKAL